MPHTDLTLREFLNETTEQLANWDGKIPQTLKTLVLKPGLLTKDFLAGRRARWLMPLRVYLICSVAYFVAKPAVEAITHRSAREMARFSLTDSTGSIQLSAEDSAEVAKGLPARLFGAEHLLRAARDSKRLNKEINASMPRAMFVLLPIFALLTRLAWRKRLPRYPAHLYLALHVHAAWFAAMTVSTILGGWVPLAIAGVVGVAMAVYIVWYALASFRNVFEESWVRTIAKSAVVGFAYLLCFSLVSAGLLGIAITRM